MDDFVQIVEKASLQAGLTAAGTVLNLGRNANIITPYGNVPAWAIGAGLGGATSVANDVLHRYVFSEIPVNKKFRHDFALAAGVVSSALMYNFAMGIVNPDLPREHGMMVGLAIGGGSEYGSTLLLDLMK